MMAQANFPKEIKNKLCKKCFNCAMHLSSLSVATLYILTATRYENIHEAKPCYAKHIRIWIEAGVSMGKHEKIGNRGIPMIFISYTKNHGGDCNHMYNPLQGT